MAAKEATQQSETFTKKFAEFDASKMDQSFQKIAAVMGKESAFDNYMYSCYII